MGMQIKKNISSGIRRFWWLLLEIFIAILFAWYGPQALNQFLKTSADMDELMLRVGSDALTLMGFTIT